MRLILTLLTAKRKKSTVSNTESARRVPNTHTQTHRVLHMLQNASCCPSYYCAEMGADATMREASKPGAGTTLSEGRVGWGREKGSSCCLFCEAISGHPTKGSPSKCAAVAPRGSILQHGIISLKWTKVITTRAWKENNLRPGLRAAGDTTELKVPAQPASREGPTLGERKEQLTSPGHQQAAATTLTSAGCDSDLDTPCCWPLPQTASLPCGQPMSTE